MVQKYLLDDLIVFVDNVEVDIDSLAVGYVFPKGSYVNAIETESPTSHDLVEKDISNKRYEGVIKAGMSIRTLEGETISEFHTFFYSSVEDGHEGL